MIEWVSQAAARALYTAGDAAHDFDHVLRVAHWALYLAKAEGADAQIVYAAALLHDAPVAADRADHHRAAAEFARTYVAAHGAAPAQADAVAHCIAAHRFRDASVMPQTLEARCLYDADKLDSMGAIGVARAFAYAGAHGNRLWWQPLTDAEAAPAAPTGADYTPLHEYVYKLRRLLDTLQTPTGRRLGQARHNRQAAFFAALDAEMAAPPPLPVEGQDPSPFTQGTA